MSTQISSEDAKAINAILLPKARSWVRNEDAALDLVKETWRRCCEKPPPADQLIPWMLGIMQNVLREWQRGEKRGWWAKNCPPEALSVVADDSPGPLAALINHENIERLKALVRQLPDSLRRYVRARYKWGKDVGSIAQELGIAPNTVHRYAQLLREELKEHAELVEDILAVFDEHTPTWQAVFLDFCDHIEDSPSAPGGA